MNKETCRMCKCSDCICHMVDHSIRLSPESQIDAILDAESYLWSYEDNDPGSDWIIYLLSIGWTEAQIYNRED